MDLKMFGRIAGADEAGRGPLCGPVVAATVILRAEERDDLLALGLADSKKITAPKRERLFERMLSLRVYWRAQAASPERIDRMNILQASLWAMRQSLMKLPLCFDTVIVDGTFRIPDIPFPQQALPKADSLVPEVAAASVIAKVLRDRIMSSLDPLYPHYGFGKHKGYPTAEHRAALAEFGPSPVHRRSFSWSAPS